MPSPWILLLLLVSCLVHHSLASCDWPPTFEDLNVQCVCGSGGNLRLTVQCGGVNLTRLVQALKSKPPLDLLAIINGTLKSLGDGVFSGLDIRALQMNGVGLASISPGAFQDLERSLSSLNLEGGELLQVPAESLRGLTALRELDLSRNRISEVADGTFEGLELTTLKMADNQLRLSDDAFSGLETTLNNLVLKGSGQSRIPSAIQRLSELTFLDLSQNQLQQLPAGALKDLRQLTVLSLERNSVAEVEAGAFQGLEATLSSLSLLNNKIGRFPAEALKGLAQLRVLDLGFNRLTSVPDDAFQGNPLLNLLALDGNPLTTLSETPFTHLNSTLRGLSIGGPTLVCDCRLRWVLEWSRRWGLRVSSRERNPHYCGRPAQHRRRDLPQMAPLELTCDDHTTPPTSTTTATTTTAQPQQQQQRSTVVPARDLRAPRTSSLDQLHLLDTTRRGTELTVRWEGYREDNLVRARSAAPVHAMYRVFGEPHFQLGTTANPASGFAQFRLSGEAVGRPLVVCVVDTAQAATLSASAVPRAQCNEVQSERVSDSQLNKVIIGSSAAVCGMIVLAVIIFVCCSRRSSGHKRPPLPPLGRPPLKSEHEWETASAYSGRSIPRARAYHGSVNPSYMPPDDVQSFRSLPPARARGHMMGSRGDLHASQIALSQLSGHHSFLGAGGYTADPWSGGGNHWDNGDAYSERHAPSRLSYGKDNF